MASTPPACSAQSVPTRAVVKLCQAVYHGNAGHFIPRAVEALRVDGFVAEAGAIVPVGAPNPDLGGAVEGFVVPCRPADWPADKGHTVFLVIRGSRSDAEWARNYERALVALPSGARAPPSARCHHGFSQSWSAISAEAAAAVAATGARTVVFAGNSRGSALVTIGLLHCLGLWRRGRGGAAPRTEGGAGAAIPVGADCSARGSSVEEGPAEAAAGCAEVGKGAHEAASPTPRAGGFPVTGAAAGSAVAPTRPLDGKAGAAAGAAASAGAPVGAAASDSTPVSAASSAAWWPDRVQLVTFASPRCGNHAMVRAVEEAVGAAGRIERWCVGTDLVPCVPPAILGYRHTRGCRYVRSLDPDTRPASQSAVTIVGAAMWAVACRIRPRCGRAPWQDHDIDSLAAWIDAQARSGAPLETSGP